MKEIAPEALYWMVVFFLMLYALILCVSIYYLYKKRIEETSFYGIQLIQSFNFSLSGLKYLFYCGSVVAIGFYDHTLDFSSALILAEFKLGIHSSNLFFYINIIPIIIIILYLYTKHSE